MGSRDSSQVRYSWLSMKTNGTGNISGKQGQFPSEFLPSSWLASPIILVTGLSVTTKKSNTLHPILRIRDSVSNEVMVLRTQDPSYHERWSA